LGDCGRLEEEKEGRELSLKMPHDRTIDWERLLPNNCRAEKDGLEPWMGHPSWLIGKERLGIRRQSDVGSPSRNGERHVIVTASI
jgi:hypothetical protein